jgi:hypothetical protein
LGVDDNEQCVELAEMRVSKDGDPFCQR